MDTPVRGPVQDIVSIYDMKAGTVINLRAAVLDLMDIKHVKVRGRGSSQVDKDVCTVPWMEGLWIERRVPIERGWDMWLVEGKVGVLAMG